MDYLADFVDSLENASILRENLDELQQTVNLMQTENPDDYYDISIRNRKFGRVDAMNGPLLLEKYDMTNWNLEVTAALTCCCRLTYTVQQSPLKNDRLANFTSRFGMK